MQAEKVNHDERDLYLLAMETVIFQAEDGITTGVKLPGEKL